jgi:hypothetical protein
VLQNYGLCDAVSCLCTTPEQLNCCAVTLASLVYAKDQTVKLYDSVRQTRAQLHEAHVELLQRGCISISPCIHVIFAVVSARLSRCKEVRGLMNRTRRPFTQGSRIDLHAIAHSI